MSRGRERDPERELVQATLRLNAGALALLLGAAAGLGLFLATNWLVLKGGPPGPDGRPIVGPTLGLLAQYFPGYRVTLAGSFVGLFWGFLAGALAGLGLGRAYNWIVSLGDPR